jgi:hypothetical protein
MALWESGFVTVTFLVPNVVVADTEILAVNCVTELNRQEFTVIPVLKLQVAPFWKLLPVMTTGSVWVCIPAAGLRLVMPGAGAGVTVKALGSVTFWASGFVTITFPAANGAVPEIEMLAVNCVAELNTQEFTMIPVPLKLQVVPLKKLLPVMTTGSA